MKRLTILLVLLLSVGFVVAHGDSYDDDYVFKEKITNTEYFPRVNRVETTVTYIDYENENRFPTRDYRYGYTYRATKEYLEDRYKVEKKSWDYNKYDWDYGRDYDYDDGDYYKYSSGSRTYEKKSCYHEAPRGKFFYIKC